MIEMKPLLLGVDKSINKCASSFDYSHFVGNITFPPRNLNPQPPTPYPTPNKNPEHFSS